MSNISLYTASTGLEAISMQIDVIANNLANVNTVGFKRSRGNFEDLLYINRQFAGNPDDGAVSSPAPSQVGLGTRISNTQLMFTQGSPVNASEPTDMTIQGDGFFRVKIYDDVGDGFGYTRAGNFIANRDGDLVLGNSDGYRLDPPVTIPTGATKIDIGPDGVVSVMLPGDTETKEVGQVKLFRFPNQTGLESGGKNVYLATPASGDSFMTSPGEGGAGTILSKFLESSNVTAVKELVNLIEKQRAFELNSKVITTSNEMLQTVTHLK